MSPPPDPQKLRSFLVWGMHMAETRQALANWWRLHEPHVRRLPQPDRAAVVAEKDRLKEVLP